MWIFQVSCLAERFLELVVQAYTDPKRTHMLWTFELRVHFLNIFP